MRKLLGSILLLVLFLYFSYQFFATRLLSGALEKSLGTKVRVQRIHLKLFPTELGIYGIKIMNYPGYEEPEMIEIPEVFARVHIPALFQKKIQVQKLVLDIKKVVVERRNGKINIKDLMDYSKKVSQGKAPAPAEPSKQRPSESKPKASILKLQIDEAQISLGKVYVVDYGNGQRNERSFDFGIQKEPLRNVTDIPSLTEQIAVLILKKVGMLALGVQVEKVANEFVANAQKTLSNIFN